MSQEISQVTLSQPEMGVQTAIAVPEKASLVARFAARFGVDKDKMLTTLKATAFRQRKADVIITNEQMMALLVVAEQYHLNPFTKEIFAFEDKGAIIPVVSVDGWLRIINDHPQHDAIEFEFSDKIVTTGGGKPCPEWCEAVIYRKDRSRPTRVREYLDEVYVGPRGGYPGPWQTHTKRMLRWKATIQAGRVAYSFSGIYDEDEASRIIDAQVIEDRPTRRVTEVSNVSALQARLESSSTIKDPPPSEAEIIDGVAEEVTQPTTPESIND